MLVALQLYLRGPARYTAFLLCIALAGCGGGAGKSSNGTDGRAPPPAKATLSVLAGSPGGVATVDGTGASARFNAPNSIAVDAGGNLYVTEAQSFTVRKITSAGVVTTLAGSPGAFGYVNGTGAAARLTEVGAAETDAAGNVYVIDEFSIRMITPAGVVSTFAGGIGFNIGGTADGTGTAARFLSPAALAIDGSGNIYVLDSTTAGVIRKVTPAAVVTTIQADTGPRGNALSMAADAAGNLYVANAEDRTIRVVHPDGSSAILAGAPGNFQTVDGTGAAAGFFRPSGIAIGAGGNLFVVDSESHVVRMVTLAGVVTTVAGNAAAPGGYADGTGANARFRNLTGIAADANGNLYIADAGNSVVRKMTPGGVVTTVAGLAPSIGSSDGPAASAQFSAAHGVAADAAGNLYVADNGNFTVRKITPAGVVSTPAGTAGVQANVLGANFGQGTIDGIGPAATFCGPEGVTVGTNGDLFVGDSCGTIREITPAGVVTTYAGNSTQGGYAATNVDGIGGAARFSFPKGIATDPAGNLYVSDMHYGTGPFGGNSFVGASIRKIAPGAIVSTLAGTGNSVGSADGTGAAALFFEPLGIAADAQGNSYVADRRNCEIRKVTPGGVVTTPNGMAGQCSATDGAAGIARFTAPNGVARDSMGNLYIVDGVSTVRKIAVDGTVTTVWGDPTQPGLQLDASPGTYFAAYGIATMDDHTFAITTGSNVLKLTVP